MTEDATMRGVIDAKAARRRKGYKTSADTTNIVAYVASPAWRAEKYAFGRALGMSADAATEFARL